MAKALKIVAILDDDNGEVITNTCLHQGDEEPTDHLLESAALHVQICQSPYLDTFFDHHAIRVTIDSPNAYTSCLSQKNWETGNHHSF